MCALHHMPYPSQASESLFKNVRTSFVEKSCRKASLYVHITTYIYKRHHFMNKVCGKCCHFFVCLFVCVSVSFSWGRPPAMFYPEIPQGETMTWPHEDDSSWCWKHGLNTARSPGCCLTIGPSCHWVPPHHCNSLDPPPCCRVNHSCLNYSHSRGFRSHGERVWKDHMKRKYHSRLKNYK